jgi:all-trans-retinol 13,14-reductase
MQLLGLPKDHDHDSCVKTIEDISQAFPWYTFFPSAKDPDWSNRYPSKQM